MSLTLLDTGLIIKHTFDEENNATRVILAKGIQLDTSNIESAIKDAFQHIEMPKYQLPEANVLPSIQTINIPTIVTEYKTIEVPVFVDRIQFVDKNIYIEVPKIIEIEKQIIVYVDRIQHIDKPIIITEFKEVEKISPRFIYLGFALISLLILIGHFIK